MLIITSTFLSGLEFSSLVSLRTLYLHNNALLRINPTAFDTLTSLTHLTLSGNLLTNFPVWDLLLSNPFLASVSLSENMWPCGNCDFLRPFGQFLLTQRHRIDDFETVQCMTGDLQARKVLPVTCSADSAGSLRNDLQLVDEAEGPNVIIPIVVSALLLVCFIVAMLVVICVFKARIKNWLYNKSSEIYESRSGSSVASGNSCYAQNKLFDVYISYSMKDADFVDQSLAPTLEQGATSFKLCLHQRDFPPSASLYDTVSVATESSSRVVVVLSKAYLESEWPHVKIPLRNSLSKDTTRLILLVLEDLGEEDFKAHPELKGYLKSCASVKWGSPGFLNKLRFFLPEPAFMTFQRNVTLRTLQPSILKSNSLMQVDQVSGVWTYTLQNSPHGSVSTQSTDDHNMPRYAGPLNAAMPPGSGHNMKNAPSVISSLYSHHTYQSIPEQVHHHHQNNSPSGQNHIYHTLEPSLVLSTQRHGQKPMTQQPEQINAVYINRNLDLVLKTSNPGSAASSPRTSKKGTPELSECESGDQEDADQEVQRAQEVHHHAHTHSSLSAQQLIPNSPQLAEELADKENEYIV